MDWLNEFHRRAARHDRTKERLRVLEEREARMLASSEERLKASAELLRTRVKGPPPT